MPNRYRAYLATFFLAVLLNGMLGVHFVFAQGHTRGGAPPQKAAPLTCGIWSVATSPNVGSNANYLYSVAAVSSSDLWAVGDYENSSVIHQTLIEHWNGTSWSVVTSPNVGSYDNFLTGVAAVSAKNIWAVGYYYYNSSNLNQTLIEHWNGTSWSVVTSPNVASTNNDLSGVTAISASNIWAVGNYDNNGIFQTLTEHWNGTSWSIVTSPNNVGSTGDFLYAVARVPGSSNVWAVGEYENSSGNGQTLIEYWNGTIWSIVTSPNVGLTGDILSGVTAISANNIWAVGYYFTSSFVQQTLIEHWNGTSWSVVTSPNVGSNFNFLYGVAAVSSSNIWAVGDYYNSSSAVQQTLIEHWNGTSWSVVTSPNVGSNTDTLSGVARVPGSSNVWTVGYDYGNSNIFQTLTEFYC